MPQLPGLAATDAPVGVITVDRPGFEVPMDRPGFEVPMDRPGFEVPMDRPRYEVPVERPSFEVPVAAQPSVDAFGFPISSQPRVPAPDTTEMPIYRSMEAVWFGGSDRPSHPQQPPPNHWTPPAASSGPPANSGSSGLPPGPQLASASARPYVSDGPPPYVPPGALPPPVPPDPPPPPPPTAPRPGPEEPWRTSADSGWQAAAAAAEPQDRGTTRSGLPKRVPAAQLVPGAVDARSTTARAKRSPDDVRGLLSAYHRGVQRGRTGGEGSSLDPRPDPEERH
jgi:hypothetical protein